MPRSALLIIALLASACGASPAARPSDPITRSEPTEVVFAATRLEDDESRSIEQALAEQIGFPLRVVARAGAGDEQIVLYSISGVTHWLAHHPQRDALVAQIQACEHDEERDPVRSCADVALQEVRGPVLLDAFMSRCLHRQSDSESARENCREMAQDTLVYDVEAYCEAGFWARAQREGSGWSIAEAGRLPEDCLERVVALHARDLDGDGRDELLLDAIYAHVDAMRLVTEGFQRTLTVWHASTPELSRSSSAIAVGSYNADMVEPTELRCRYELDSSARPSLALECCDEPVDEDEDEDQDQDPGGAGSGAEHVFVTWPPTDSCSPHWRDTYPPAERGDFRVCGRVTERDVVVRAEPDEQSHEVEVLGAEDRVHEVGRRGDWIEIVVSGQRGFIPLASTRDGCASAP